MIDIKIKDIVDGNIDFYWPCSDYNGYAIMLEYLVDNNVYEKDAIFKYHEGVVIEPDGDIVNYYYEQLDIVPLISNPPKTFVIISDYSVPFITINSNKVMQTKFHYIDNCDNYLGSLHRKKRWKFKNELKKETDISIEEVDIDKEFSEFFKNRLIELNDKDDYLDLYAEIILLKNSEQLVRSFKLTDSKGLCGIASTIKIGNVYYVIIFNSIRPCLYSCVNYLTTLLDKDSIIHFGASEEYGGTNKFLYKKNISNNFINVPYLFIGEEGNSPYYSISKEKWFY